MAYVTDIKHGGGLSLAPIGRAFKAVYRALIQAQERRAQRLLADYESRNLTW